MKTSSLKTASLKNSTRIRHLFAGLVLAVVAAQNIVAPVSAGDDSQGFVSKKYDIKGGWQLLEENGQTIIRFDESFATKGGPDLKIFLSPKSIKKVTGKTAVDGSLLLGVLESTNGTQDYIIPEGVSLDDYESILVHCQQFSVLWGGGNLNLALAAS